MSPLPFPILLRCIFKRRENTAGRAADPEDRSQPKDSWVKAIAPDRRFR